MIRFLALLIVTAILTHALILGAWLAGATPSGWTFGLAWVFSFFISLFCTVVGVSREL
jgi:hypothetical protein